MKAKRKLSDFSFEKSGCHVSLVGPSMGSGANGYTALLLKSLSPKGNDNSQDGKGNGMEMIEKAAHEKAVQKAVEDATAVMKSKLEAIEATLKKHQDEQVARVEKSRKESLKEVIGESELEGTFKAIKDLDDASFEVVLKGFKAAKDKESKGAMFTEQGHSGVAEIKQVESGVLKALKAKHQAK